MDNLTSTSNPWRLLQTEPARGAWNMAVDEAILEAIGRGKSRPTLRLYSWDPPCLSLGYAQPSADVDLDRLHTLQWDLVRRPTGGRAILHTDELTYSVTGPTTEPCLSGSVLDSYNRLSAALLRALHLLDIPAEATPQPAAQPGSDPKGPVCFEVPSNYEITIQGKKLVGSAQARRREGVLQHGTLPLYGDLSRITQALAFADESQREAASRRVHSRAVTVEEATGRRFSLAELVQAFRQAFQIQLGLELTPAPLSDWEKHRAEELVQEKFDHPDWTHRM